MKLPKFLTGSKPINAVVSDSELCGLMRDAIDATAAGSSPWHLKETKEIIDTGPFTREEAVALNAHRIAAIVGVRRDILKRKLTEVLTGAIPLKVTEVLPEMVRMGEPQVVEQGGYNIPKASATAIKDAYLRRLEMEEQKQKYEEAMRNAAYGCNTQFDSMQQMQNAQNARGIPHEKRSV